MEAWECWFWHHWQKQQQWGNVIQQLKGDLSQQKASDLPSVMPLYLGHYQKVIQTVPQWRLSSQVMLICGKLTIKPTIILCSLTNTRSSIFFWKAWSWDPDTRQWCLRPHLCWSWKDKKMYLSIWELTFPPDRRRLLLPWLYLGSHHWLSCHMEEHLLLQIPEV